MVFGGEAGGVSAMEVVVVDAKSPGYSSFKFLLFLSSLPSQLSQTHGPFTRGWPLVLPPSLGLDGAP